MLKHSEENALPNRVAPAMPLKKVAPPPPSPDSGTATADEAEWEALRTKRAQASGPPRQGLTLAQSIRSRLFRDDGIPAQVHSPIKTQPTSPSAFEYNIEEQAISRMRSASNPSNSYKSGTYAPYMVKPDLAKPLRTTPTSKARLEQDPPKPQAALTQASSTRRDPTSWIKPREEPDKKAAPPVPLPRQQPEEDETPVLPPTPSKPAQQEGSSRSSRTSSLRSLFGLGSHNKPADNETKESSASSGKDAPPKPKKNAGLPPMPPPAVPLPPDHDKKKRQSRFFSRRKPALAESSAIPDPPPLRSVKQPPEESALHSASPAPGNKRRSIFFAPASTTTRESPLKTTPANNDSPAVRRKSVVARLLSSKPQGQDEPAKEPLRVRVARRLRFWRQTRAQEEEEASMGGEEDEIEEDQCWVDQESMTAEAFSQLMAELKPPKVRPGQTLVLQPGAANLVLGLASDETPRSVVPAVVGRKKSHNKDLHGLVVPARRGSMLQPAEPGVTYGCEAMRGRGLNRLEYASVACSEADERVATDFDQLARIAAHALEDDARLPLGAHPVLILERAGTSQAHRQALVQMAFVALGAPAVSFASEPLLVLKKHLGASDDVTGVVVDIGDLGTRVVPIVKGKVRREQVEFSPVGGRVLTDRLRLLVQHQGRNLETTAEWEIAREMKERLAFVSADPERDRELAKNSTKLDKAFDLPDSNVIVLNSERFECTEILFNPGLDSLMGYQRAQSIQIALKKALNAVSEFEDGETQRALFTNIVVAGGTAELQGLVSRLQREVEAVFKGTSLKCIPKVSKAERFVAFKGGKLFCADEQSKSTFISVKQYADFKDRIVNYKATKSEEV